MIEIVRRFPAGRPFAGVLRAMSLALVAALVLTSPVVVSAADTKISGEVIYRRQCASCHGNQGQGNPDEFPEPLTGDRPLRSLTKYIVEKMPEGEPHRCTGEEAERVSQYVFETFYSKQARLRNKPPRIELARLTVRQYQQSIADLVALLDEPARPEQGVGLTGEYFNSGRRFDTRRRVLKRLDPAVDFSFGETPPAEKINAEEYAARWSGGVVVPETGEYEFIVQAQNGFKLWINDPSEPLIDAWVRSGEEQEVRESITLLGGHTYGVRLEFFKSKQDKTAAITLKWQRPHHVDEVIPTRYLVPGRFPLAFVTGAAFPPDDRSLGYERGTSISKAWDEATTAGALEAAALVAVELESGRSDARDKARDFCRRFAERALRRPLSDAERAFYVDDHFADGVKLELSIKMSILLALKSPRFLYRELAAAPEAKTVDPYETAARISFALWDALPDRELLAAAAAGRLNTDDDVRREAGRMFDHPRTRAKLREFVQFWLAYDRTHDVAKDPELFPDFNPQLMSDLRDSLDLFVEDVVFSPESDFRELLTANRLLLNGRLAAVYGAELAPEADFQAVVLNEEPRSGVISHPLLLSGMAYHATSSPIHRGVFVARNLLGRRLRPPPDAVTPASPKLHPNLSTRERIALQTQPESCQTCHAMINPLGFPLEHFDAVGRFRRDEQGQAIDSTGYYETLTGDREKFENARDLGTFLAASSEVHAAFVEQLFQHLIKQPVLAYGHDCQDKLQAFFVQNGYNVRKLMIELVTLTARHDSP